MKNYTVKKKIVIASLALVAIVLAGGLWVYMDSMTGKVPDTTMAGEPSGTEVQEITVPEIKPSEKPSSSSATTPDTKPPSGAGDSPSTSTDAGQQQKPSDGKPKTQDEATPPPKPESAPTETHEPSITADSQTPPSSEPAPAKPENSTPKSGDKNDNGDIYVPGFGWIPDSGENVQEKGDFELSGEIIGH